MLTRLLVVSPNGPCFVNRTYKKSQNDVDSQLISGMVALGSAGNVKLTEITRILKNEAMNDPNSNIEIIRTHNYITCAISSDYSNRQRIRDILPKVNQMTYEVLGNPKDVSSIDGKKIDTMENRIDILMIKEGLLNS
ncbi:MAG: hypothetical protein ACXAD7_02280 [Candidatus Kariarchaeaceae archaeon]|jgi:hypothetical protein